MLWINRSLRGAGLEYKGMKANVYTVSCVPLNLLPLLCSQKTSSQVFTPTTLLLASGKKSEILSGEAAPLKNTLQRYLGVSVWKI